MFYEAAIYEILINLLQWVFFISAIVWFIRWVNSDDIGVIIRVISIASLVVWLGMCAYEGNAVAKSRYEYNCTSLNQEINELTLLLGEISQKPTPSFKADFNWHVYPSQSLFNIIKTGEGEVFICHGNRQGQTYGYLAIIRGRDNIQYFFSEYSDDDFRGHRGKNFKTFLAEKRGVEEEIIKKIGKIFY